MTVNRSDAADGGGLGIGSSERNGARLPSATRELDFDADEFAARKRFLELGPDDVRRLAGMNDLAESYADDVIEDFYRHLLQFEDAREYFGDPATLAQVKRMQKNYFLQLTGGQYDATYGRDRLRIGEVHERIGLPMKLYLGMYSFYLRAVAARIFESAAGRDPDLALGRFMSVIKLTFLDMGLAIDTYISQRERTIRDQQEAIRKLSTPALQLRDGLLILPIIGIIDAPRARQLTEQLLQAIRANRAKVVVMDVTGVGEIDSATANHLVQTVEASRLMGTTVILTGLSPDIAHTLVKLGIDLSRVQTVGDLQGGIDEADRLLGYTVTRADPYRSPVAANGEP